ncbi:MAG: MarP family serine protease [Microbacteriaceae bacterium]|nr:MarP family serine protease [Microbacteriaceae bacterium]
MIQSWQLDLVLALLILTSVGFGLRSGLVRSVFSLAGGFLGVVVAVFTVPLISSWITTAQWRVPASLATSALLVLGGVTLGTRVGLSLRHRLDKTSLKLIDRTLGGVFSGVAVALIVATLSAGITAIGAPALSQPIASSGVLRTINDLTPSTVRLWIAQLRFAAIGKDLPSLADVLPGRPAVIPPDAIDSPALAKAALSVVKITGNAYACGQNQSGSGFVVAPNRILTNAHVVAGVQQPVVESARDGARTGEVVFFDPVGDVAIIAVRDLPTRALALGSVLAAGATAVVNGYPLGGPFSSHPASVVSVGVLRVPDIQGNNPRPRHVYTLAAKVQQGESGGPLLNAAGQIAGVVFAKGANSPDVGFATTAEDIAPVIASSPTLRKEVSSGGCTVG